MRGRVKSLSAGEIVAGAAILAACVYVAWLGFGYQSMGDYPGDYAPAMNALLAGHVGSFFAQLPTNGAGASLLLRAPGALVGKLLLGSQLAIFRFGALECMLAVAALGVWLGRQMRAAGQPAGACLATVGLLILTPAALDAIRFGHPEEPLGAMLCIAAVIAAAARRPTLAGALLGLAVINKPWGVLAILPTLLASPEERWRVGLVAGAIAGGWIGAAYLASPSHFGRIVLGASTSVVAHPVDVWWPWARLHVAPGVERAYLPPAVISAHARELAVLLSIPLSLPLARKPDRGLPECLALLALLFLLRCLLDPSNHVYYEVPAVLALAGWEIAAGRAPLLAMLGTAGFWLVFHTISGIAGLDLQFAAYLAVSVPLVVTVLPAATGAGELRLRRRARWAGDSGYRAVA